MAQYNSETYWQEQIRSALKWRGKKAKEDLWVRATDYYEHNLAVPGQPNFNLVYMLGSTLIPNLIFQFPHIQNSPRRPEFVHWARIFDGIDNWLLHEMDAQEKMEEAVLEAFLKNVCAIQIAYDFPQLKTLNDRIEEITFDKVPHTLDATRKTNQTWLDVIPADRLIVAAGTRGARNCRWFGKMHLLPVRIAKELPGLKSKAVITATHIPEEVKKHQGNDFTGDEAEDNGYISFWEIHNHETAEWFMITSQGKFMFEPTEDPLQVDGLPIEFLTFNKSNHIWGTPDTAYIESCHLEGNEIRVDARLQRKVALVKAFYDGSIIDEEDFEKFVMSDPMGGVPLKLPPDKSISEVISLVQPHVQQEFEGEMKRILNDSQLLIGSGPNQAGTVSSGRRTKAEIQIVEERNLLRTGRRRARVADVLSRHINRANAITSEYWNGSVLAKVIGVEGAIHWVTAQPKELREVSANLISSVNVESLAPASQERRRDEMMKVLEIMGKVQGMETQFLQVLNNFLSSFDWSEIQQTLPQANPGAASVGAGQFQQQQQQAMANPQATAQQAQGNIGGVEQLVRALPQRSTGVENGR